MTEIQGTSVISGKAEWDDVFRRLPVHLRDVNFSFDYYNLYGLNGNGKPQLFIYAEGDHFFFYPYLLREINTTMLGEQYFDIESAYGYSGPVSTTADKNFIQQSFQTFRNHCRENKIVTEFIRFHPLIENHQVAADVEGLSIVSLRDYVYVDLQQSEQAIWESYTSQNRNKIRKAEKNGVEVIHDYACSYFDDFVRIYRKNMELLNASGLYLFSQPFFDGLKELVKKKGLILIARNKAGVLGASVFLLGSIHAHYFLSSANDEGKKLAVSNLLLGMGITHCKKSGMQKIHLGGGMTGAPDDSLLIFKKNFSNLTAKFFIGKSIHYQEQYDLLCADWDQRFAPESAKYVNILQRYRWTKSELL